MVRWFVLLRHTHRPQMRPYPICTSRRGNARHLWGGGRVAPGGWLPVSGIKMRSLGGVVFCSKLEDYTPDCVKNAAEK